MKKYSLHMEYHEKSFENTSRNLNELNAQLSVTTDSGSIQQRLGRFQRQHQLKVVTQKFEHVQKDDFFERIIIKQTLEGKYRNHVDYLKEVLAPGNPLMLVSGTFQNRAPTKDDPPLLADLELILFLPSK
ncbi:MAG: hypothetical protein GY866_05625 [Proteobacteria bacterium]|nr:hypothetical protein [Pseudomonadota bacterium]